MANKPLTDEQWQQKLKSLEETVRKQADALPDGWVELEVPVCEDTGAKAFTLKLPRIPFERWMRNSISHRHDEWPNVCPSGMKMQLDNRDHSDWWLTTGIPIQYSYGRMPYNDPAKMNDLYGYEPGDEGYREPDLKADEYVILAKRINDASWHHRFESTENRRRNSIFLVSTKKEIEGRVVHVRTVNDIASFVDEAIRWKKSYFSSLLVAVVPNCSIEFDAVIRHAGAIITEVGSAAAHLVKVAREDKLPVIMCPSAFEEYFDGERIKIKDKYIHAMN